MLDLRFFWFFCTFLRKRYAKIGKFSYLGPPIFVKTRRKNFRIGDRVRVFPGSRIEVLGRGSISIGRNTSIGHSVTFTCSDKTISIGENCVISSNVFFGSQNYDFAMERNSNNWFHRAQYENDIIIGDNVFIGYGAMILGGARIASNSTVNAYAVVRSVHEKQSVIRR